MLGTALIVVFLFGVHYFDANILNKVIASWTSQNTIIAKNLYYYLESVIGNLFQQPL